MENRESDDARAKRYIEACERLKQEREVIDYLRAKGKDSAAEVAQRNILRMEQQVDLFRRDLPPIE